MTPDELIAEIYRIQRAGDPDTDPGDIDINIQDDMAMVAVHQWALSPRELGTGTTIQEALENALASVEA